MGLIINHLKQIVALSTTSFKSRTVPLLYKLCMFISCDIYSKFACMRATQLPATAKVLDFVKPFKRDTKWLDDSHCIPEVAVPVEAGPLPCLWATAVTHKLQYWIQGVCVVWKDTS